MADDEDKVLLTEDGESPEEKSEKVTNEQQLEDPKSEDGSKAEGTNTEEEKIEEMRQELDKALGLGIPPNTPPQDEQGQGEQSQPVKKDYVAPLADPYSRAMKYLAKHDILQLFQGITAGIVYKRPTDPLSFMVGEIETLQEQERLRTHEIKKNDASASKEQKADADKPS